MATVGDRVSLRYRVPDGLADVVGEIEALTPLVSVRTKSGETHHIVPGDVVSVRELSHVTVRNSEIRALEHAAALAWPGTEQHWHDGWLLRAGGGHTSRANSAVPLLFEADLRALPTIVDWYAHRDLPAWLALPERLLPVKTPGTKPTRVLVRDITADITPEDVPVQDTVRPTPDAAWLRIYERAVPVDVLTAVGTGEETGQVAFATHSEAAVGRGAVTTAPDGTVWAGISCVRVTEHRRRRGHARTVCSALLGWAAGRGATRAYVQVLADNEPAATLYHSMGFRLHHTLRYLRAESLLPDA
ncbi:N-acetyltransferase GCN5 [Mycolicibacterium canariasense]|uniref:N-acetyltransferase GCN5 n=1 Tax=Mycolicibacterium canariasense TaxID=228230 RepID=A0A117IBD8_MYCCR|nr:GNAT family N-acetyltransferase [Mycolicibacterium canariasense]MCV7209744.1 GNAT family N-acetyltransferase [Mycolicibacterium canariasense]ORU99649.1 GCN5 family acetyltransferase [Mycolicibacterium canariasense]GAS97757.1 N-acetyltransferase GCN5 [Mycolicibacterium canariasense]